MEIVLIVFIAIIAYLLIILIISSIRGLLSIKDGTDVVKKKFTETFWFLFAELLNPFNWI